MAQKALKTLATRNAARLNQTHIITLALHILFLLLRLLFRSVTRRSLLLYVLLSAPSLGIETVFELISRPKHLPNGEVQKAGEDLAQGGVTEWMWDIVYWTWACLVLVSVLGDWAWWAWAAVPAYSLYLGWSIFMRARGGMGLGGGQDGEEKNSGGGQSKRQEKMEKRGGQKVRYR
ncbi:MAG: hypothetical protein Q9162_002889 [Coniocarpon cinnabarinum]